VSKEPETASNAKPDWAAIQIAYEHNDMTVAEILLHFDISQSRLYAHIHADDWQRRRFVTPPEANTAAPALNKGARLADAQTKRAALAARLFHALEERIMSMEDDMHDHDASHGERDAKALTAMAKALDLLGEMIEATEADSTAKEASGREEVDVDEFRTLLTDRLERLRASRNDC
jgi:hypothetical protein